VECFKVYPVMRLEELRKTTEIFSQNSLCPGRNRSCVAAECKSGSLDLQMFCRSVDQETISIKNDVVTVRVTDVLSFIKRAVRSVAQRRNL
jgi:hypothetical protein